MSPYEPTGLLSDPFLQLPDADGVRVVWFTDIEGGEHRVVLADGRVFVADDRAMSRMTDGERPLRVRRHEAHVHPLPQGRTPYRVESEAGGHVVTSDEFTLAPALPHGAGARILLTSDHQLAANVGTCMELAARTLGPVDAVVFSGDLVNVPDAAHQWFDDDRAFFRTMQGRARAEDRGGHVSPGAAILQHAPLFPAIGNHEVQGRIAGDDRLGMSAVPRHVADALFDGNGDREHWVEDNSWSTRTYDELFTLPTNPSGHSHWYATTIGNARLITLFHTRVWRSADAQPVPSRRRRNSRFHDAADALDDPLRQGHGCFPFASLAPGSEQFEWLVAELDSPERRACRYTVVQIHEAAHGLGGNVHPPFGEPERIEEHDDAGRLIGIRYEYAHARNDFYRHVMPMLERAGVQLVLSGHSHVWNRFVSGGTHYLEASHAGDTHGAHTVRNRNARPIPPHPWNSDEYVAYGDPYGAEPVAPNVAPLTFPDGEPMPYVADQRQTMFQLLDTHAGEVTTWRAEVGAELPEPVLMDRFTLD